VRYITVRIPDGIYRWLREWCHRTKEATSAVVREALIASMRAAGATIDEKLPPLPLSAGRVKIGRQVKSESEGEAGDEVPHINRY